MPKVRQDEVGLYVSAEGYRARPLRASRFSEGEVVKAYHVSQSTRTRVRSMDGALEEKWSISGAGYEYRAFTHALQRGWINEQQYSDMVQSTLYSLFYGNDRYEIDDKLYPGYQVWMSELGPGKRGSILLHHVQTVLKRYWADVR